MKTVKDKKSSAAMATSIARSKRLLAEVLPVERDSEYSEESNAAKKKAKAEKKKKKDDLNRQRDDFARRLSQVEGEIASCRPDPEENRSELLALARRLESTSRPTDSDAACAAWDEGDAMEEEEDDD